MVISRDDKEFAASLSLISASILHAQIILYKF